jgi:hypothetical protein
MAAPQLWVRTPRAIWTDNERKRSLSCTPTFFNYNTHSDCHAPVLGKNFLTCAVILDGGFCVYYGLLHTHTHISDAAEKENAGV